MVDFQLVDFLAPYRIYSWRRRLWKSQYETAEFLRRLQWQLLSPMLDHCFTHVPYYKKLFKKLGMNRGDFRSLDDVSLLPVLEKADVIENHDDFKPENFEKYHAREIRSSGTTGTPLVLYWDISSNVMELVCQWRHFSWMGYRLGDPFLDIRALVEDYPGDYKWNWKCRALQFCSNHLAESNVKKYVELLRRYRIKMWRGHPASIYLLCQFLKEARIDDVKPRIIITCAETLFPFQREFIEAWAGVKIGDNYGLKEHNALVCQCPEGGYHVASEYGLLEILQEDGRPAEAGQEGRIVATDLHKKVFPLLRYDTGDDAVPSARACSCGRTLPLLERIDGRHEDFLLRTDGRWVSGARATFRYTDGVRMAQVVQRQPGAVDVYVVLDKSYTSEMEAFIQASMKNKLGASMNVYVHKVDQVPFNSARKFKVAVCLLERT